jgi:hypothetical protein
MKFWKTFFKYWIRPWAPFILLIAAPLYADDNVILIDQSGDNLDLTVDQIGYGNKIGSSLNYADILGLNSTVTLKQWNRSNEIWLYSNGSNNTLKILQGSETGVSGNNDADLVVYGDTNNVTLLQDRNDAGNDDPNADGYHDTSVYIVGNNNNVWQAQRNNGTWGSGPDGHVSQIDIYGNYADIDIVQQADVKKTLSIDIDADYVTADIRQNGHGLHSITLDVDNDNSTFDLDQGYNPGATSGHSMSISTSGTQPSYFTINQASNTPQTYSVTQACYTTGGCTVSVTQN